MIAIHFAREAERKGLAVDFPFLLATTGAANSVWQFGLSASAPLLMNTPGNFLEQTTGPMPLRTTIFAPAALLFVAGFLAALFHPRGPSPRCSTCFASSVDSHRATLSRYHAGEDARPPGPPAVRNGTAPGARVARVPHEGAFCPTARYRVSTPGCVHRCNPIWQPCSAKRRVTAISTTCRRQLQHRRQLARAAPQQLRRVRAEDKNAAGSGSATPPTEL